MVMRPTVAVNSPVSCDHVVGAGDQCGALRPINCSDAVSPCRSRPVMRKQFFRDAAEFQGRTLHPPEYPPMIGRTSPVM